MGRLERPEVGQIDRAPGRRVQAKIKQCTAYKHMCICVYMCIYIYIYIHTHITQRYAYDKTLNMSKTRVGWLRRLAAPLVAASAHLSKVCAEN